MAPENKYLYNGKELSADYEINLYDYGARWYDPAVGRFTGVDPSAEEFPWVSTYNYAENEPVANIDLHGLQKVRAVNEFKSRVAGATEAVGRKLERGMGYVNAKYTQAENAFWSALGYEPSSGLEVMTGEGEFAGRGGKDREGTSSGIVDGLALPNGGGAGLNVWRNPQLESFENVANGLDKAVDAYLALLLIKLLLNLQNLEQILCLFLPLFIIPMTLPQEAVSFSKDQNHRIQEGE